MEKHVLNTIDPKIIGARLMESRQARRLTQQQVAEALQLSRSTVISMEKGERRPKAQELISLSQLFGRPVSDFVANEPLTSDQNFIVYFRNAYGSPPADQARSRSEDVERFERYCRWYFELEDFLESPLPRRYPAIYDIEGTAPERAAEEVANSERNRLGLGDGPISNLMELLETDVGVRIFAFEMDNKSTAGMFLHTERFGSCIAVNANHPEERRRWSAAHEYAHFLTDRHRPEISVLRSSRRIPKEERFADAFAGYFLMPATSLFRRFEAVRRSKAGKPITPADVLRLSSLYRVSFQAMTLRLEELKLLPIGTYDRLKDLGFKPETARKSLLLKREDSELSKLTTRYATLAVQAFERSLLTEKQLAERLGTDLLGAREVVSSLTNSIQESEDGSWEQVALDLSADLVHVD